MLNFTVYFKLCFSFLKKSDTSCICRDDWNIKIDILRFRNKHIIFNMEWMSKKRNKNVNVIIKVKKKKK